MTYNDEKIAVAIIEGLVAAMIGVKDRMEDQDKAIAALLVRIEHQGNNITLLNTKVDSLDRIVKVLEQRNIKYDAPAQPVYTPPPMWTSPNTAPYTWPKNPFDVTCKSPPVAGDKSSY